MTSKKLPVVRKPSKRISDSPAKVIRSADAATSDSGAIRFGGGMAPASLRK